MGIVIKTTPSQAIMARRIAPDYVQVNDFDRYDSITVTNTSVLSGSIVCEIERIKEKAVFSGSDALRNATKTKTLKALAKKLRAI